MRKKICAVSVIYCAAAVAFNACAAPSVEKAAQEQFSVSGEQWGENISTRLKAAQAQMKTAAAEGSVGAKTWDQGQSLVPKFRAASDGINSLKSNLQWLRQDMQRLQSRASTIQSNHQPDSFFESELRNRVLDLQRYADDAQRIYYDLQNLTRDAVQSGELYRIASEMDYAVQDLDRSFYFDIESPAQQIYSAVNSLDVNLVGSSAKFEASDLQQQAGDLGRIITDMSSQTQELVRKTR